MTFFARFVPSNGHARFFAEECLFELESKIFPQIGAALHPAATPSASTPEQVSEAEELAKDIAEILKYGRIDTGRSASRTPEPRMPIPVVNRALLRIGEHGVGLAHFFKLFFGVRIIRVAVGMVLQSKLAISALQFDFGDGAAYPQHFVVIAFCICSQNMPLVVKASRNRLVSDLFSGILRDLHHGGTQQAILELVATLQLLKHFVVRNIRGLDHLDRLVIMRIERFALGRDRAHA
jgi:hypothetical protein